MCIAAILLTYRGINILCCCNFVLYAVHGIQILMCACAINFSLEYTVSDPQVFAAGQLVGKVSDTVI